MTQAPHQELRDLLSEVFRPCRKFGTCPEAVWKPESGHVPRGFLGATDSLESVELVMVFAQPGHPHSIETYSSDKSAETLLMETVGYVGRCFETGTDQFHRNVRWFLNQLFPDESFAKQLSRVWMTEGRLCSIADEIGNLRDRTCSDHFLKRQIALLPHAQVAAFGGKAQWYLKKLGVEHLSAYSFAPPGANHRPARPSWEAVIESVRERRIHR